MKIPPNTVSEKPLFFQQLFCSYSSEKILSRQYFIKCWRGEKKRNHKE